uniref:Endonuclease MutS2 n=1 Tax=uncultured Planctomycetota bacterium TaxID=120965 RepID=A0A5B8JPB2_9BACT|nr:endonuclease MutS2 [uncultured Planctomycetota bacterium]
MDDHSLECLDFVRIRNLLAGYALSGLGKALAGNVRPVTRAALVRRWLAQVEELLRLMEERGMPPFGGITDVRELLQRCAPPLRVTVEEVSRIGDALAGTHAVAEHLKDLPESYPELRHLAGRVGDFRTIADRIRSVIDERSRVRDDASPKLQRVRAEIEDASAEIHRSVQRLLHEPDIRRVLQYPNHTFHGDRLVLPLRAEHRGRLPGIIHRSSDTGATVYVEPAAVVELNNRISNLRSEEQEEIGRLLWDLAHEIHLNGREIHKTLDTLAVLDLIVAKVRFAKDFELRCPRISEDGSLNVHAARHPFLVELARRKQAAGQTPAEVVPIDYRLGQDFKLLIITGPNTGGKTVTLKTVGLVSLMVQAGIPAPVGPESEVGIFSHVLIDVGDEQSMQQSLSTFSGHLTRILDMLRRAGPRTLILIDELGAGTDPDEGAALGRAMLDELLRLHCLCMVTTHLGALKGFALTHAGAENACVDFDTETLEPTFHLRIGEPGQSNAIEVAQRLGMSRRMISAARRNVSRKARVLQSALEGTRVVKRRAEDARREAETARYEAGAAQTAADAARTRLQREQAEFQRWVQRVVHLQAGDPVRVRNFDRDGKIVRMRLEQQRAEVDVGSFAVEVPLGDVLPPETPAPPPKLQPKPRPAQRPQRPQVVRPPTQGRARSAPTAPGPRHERKSQPTLPALTVEQAAALKPLDAVYVQRFQRQGRIARLNPAKRIAIVSVGQLEVEVPFDGLALLGKPKPVKPRPANTPPKEAVKKPDKPPEATEQGQSSAEGTPDQTPAPSPAPEAPPAAASPEATESPAPPAEADADKS